MDDEVREVLAALLEANNTCALATQGEAGPWVATTYYAEDGVNLFCLLTHGTKTLANAEKNRSVACSIDDGTPVTFVQLRGELEVLEDEAEIGMGKDLLVAKIPAIAGFMSQPNFSIVRIRPKRIYVSDFTKGWFPARAVDP